MNQLKAILKTNKFKYISSNERCLWFPVDQSIMYVLLFVRNSLYQPNRDEERKKIDVETNELIEIFKNEIDVEAQIYHEMSNTNDHVSSFLFTSVWCF